MLCVMFVASVVVGVGGLLGPNLRAILSVTTIINSVLHPWHIGVYYYMNMSFKLTSGAHFASSKLQSRRRHKPCVVSQLANRAYRYELAG
jgi:hypothetical protein